MILKVVINTETWVYNMLEKKLALTDLNLYQGRRYEFPGYGSAENLNTKL